MTYTKNKNKKTHIVVKPIYASFHSESKKFKKRIVPADRSFWTSVGIGYMYDNTGPGGNGSMILRDEIKAMEIDIKQKKIKFQNDEKKRHFGAVLTLSSSAWFRLPFPLFRHGVWIFHPEMISDVLGHTFYLRSFL